LNPRTADYYYAYVVVTRPKCSALQHRKRVPNKEITRNVFFIIILSGVRLSPLGTAVTAGLLYPPHMIDDCGAIGGMKISRGNRSSQSKPTPAPLCPPQIQHDETRARTRVAAVGSQRLTV
jgi:hypothetical protein